MFAPVVNVCREIIRRLELLLLDGRQDDGTELSHFCVFCKLSYVDFTSSVGLVYSPITSDPSRNTKCISRLTLVAHGQAIVDRRCPGTAIGGSLQPIFRIHL